MRLLITSDQKTGLGIHATNDDGTLLPVNIALALVTSAYHSLLIEHAKIEIARDTKRLDIANGDVLKQFPHPRFHG